MLGSAAMWTRSAGEASTSYATSNLTYGHRRPSRLACTRHRPGTRPLNCSSKQLTYQPAYQAKSQPLSHQSSGIHFQLTLPEQHDPQDQHLFGQGDASELMRINHVGRGQHGQNLVGEPMLQAIQSAESLPSLHAALLQLQPAQLEGPVSRAAMVRLRRLHRRGPQQQQQAAAAQQTQDTHAVVEVLASGMQRMHAEDLSQLATLLLDLRVHDAAIMQGIMAAAWQLAPSMAPATAASLLWLFARSHRQTKPPGPSPSEAVLDALLERACLGQNPEAASAATSLQATITRALYATALLRHAPPMHCMDTALMAVSLHLESFDGPQLATIVWSLATLQHNPGQSWMHALLGRAERCVRTFSTGTSLASMLWGLATLRVAPSAAWMSHFLWQVQRRLPVTGAHSLSNVAWALATLHYRPNTAWSAAFVRVLLQRLIPKTPPKAAGAAVRDAQQPASSPLARTPAPGQPMQPHLKPPTPQAYAITLWALAKLGITPQRVHLRRLCEAMVPLLTSFTPRDLAHTMWALQRMHFLPDEDWMVMLSVALRARLRHFDTPCLVIMLTALGGYHTTYSIERSIVTELCMQLTPRVPRLGLDNITAVCVALARLCGPGDLPRPLHDALLTSLDRHIVSLTTLRNAANIAWALSQLAGSASDMHLRSGMCLMPRLAAVAAQQLQAANWADLAQFAVAFAQANYHPGEEWLEAHELFCARLVARDTVSKQEWTMVLQAYETMGYVGERLESAVKAVEARHVKAAAAAAATAAAELSQLRDQNRQKQLLYGARTRASSSQRANQPRLRAPPQQQEQQQHEGMEVTEHTGHVNGRSRGLPTTSAGLRTSLFTLSSSVQAEPEQGRSGTSQMLIHSRPAGAQLSWQVKAVSRRDGSNSSSSTTMADSVVGSLSEAAHALQAEEVHGQAATSVHQDTNDVQPALELTDRQRMRRRQQRRLLVHPSKQQLQRQATGMSVPFASRKSEGGHSQYAAPPRWLHRQAAHTVDTDDGEEGQGTAGQSYDGWTEDCADLRRV